MNKLLVFAVLCIASASCVELENLCSSDHFEYNGVLVNAFHRSRLNITFPSLSYYLVNSSITCDPSEFVNKTNYWEALKIKNNFNRKFAQIYTNDLNDATAEELGDKWFELFKVGWGPLYDMREVEPSSTCVQTFFGKIFTAYYVLNTLEQVVKYDGYPYSDESGFRPNVFESIKILEALFEKLNTGAATQTFALKDKKAFDIYFKRGLVLKREFKFLTDASVQPDTKSMLIYEQFMPFNNAQHTDKGCVPVEQLPLFYKNKGTE